MSALTFPAADRTLLAADLFEPPAGAGPTGAVVIASAMGVPRRIYRPFAEELAARGYAVLTFDYRGIGGSAPPRLRGYGATLVDWGVQDLTGALDFLQTRFPEVPLLHFGHSVGGQLLGLVQGKERLKGSVMVASQSGYWRLWPTRKLRRWMFLNWHLVIPGFARALGYLPMRRFGAGEDLPARVALQWARWGRRPEYILGQDPEGFAAFDRPLHAFAIEDDHYAPEPTVRALLRLYSRAPSRFTLLTTKDAGRPIGHFGFFKPHFRDTLWPRVIGALAGPGSP